MTEAFKAGFNAYMEKFSENVPIVKNPIDFGRPFTRNIQIDKRAPIKNVRPADVAISVRRKAPTVMEEPPVVRERKGRVAPVLAEDPNTEGRIMKTSALNYLIKLSAQVNYHAPEWDEFYRGPTNTYRKNPRGFDVPPGYVLIYNEDPNKSPYLMRADSEAAQKSMQGYKTGVTGQAAPAPATEPEQAAEAAPTKGNDPVVLDQAAGSAPVAAATTVPDAPAEDSEPTPAVPATAPAQAQASPAPSAPAAAPVKSTRVRYDEATGTYRWSDGRTDPFTDKERKIIEKIHARRGRTKPINWGDQPAPAASTAAAPAAPTGSPAPAATATTAVPAAAPAPAAAAPVAAAPVAKQKLGVIPGVTDKNTPNVAQPAEATPTVRPGNIAAIS